MDENFRVPLDEGTSAWETVGPTSRSKAKVALTPENPLCRTLLRKEKGRENPNQYFYPTRGGPQRNSKEPRGKHRKKDADLR